MIDRPQLTACPLDCPDTCGIRLDVADDGALSRVKGNKDHAWSRGSLCGKTASYHDLANDPSRLRTPLLRNAHGSFEETTWDRALAHIVSRMDGIDGADVLALYYAGNMGLVQRRFPLRLMHALGATLHDNGVCDATAEVGFQTVMGRSVGPDLDVEMDPARCDHFLLWGSDAKRTSPHLMGRLRELCKAGVPVRVIDIYRSETIQRVEEWGGRGLVVHPGSDAALALGLIARAFDERAADLEFLKEHCVGAAELRAEVTGAWPTSRIAEITGLDEAAITQLSTELHAAKRPLIKAGIGFARRRNGGESMRAVASLAAVLGRGDRVFFQTSDHFGIDTTIVDGAHLRTAPMPPIVSQVGLGSMLDEGRFRAAFVWGHNPATVLPDANRVRRGLERDDVFLVVHELFMTETAKRADVVLPATAMAEHSDLFRSYGHRTIHASWRAMPPMAESRSNVDCFSAIGRALGLATDDRFHDETGRSPFDVDQDELVGKLLAANRSRFTDDEYPRVLAGEPVKLQPPVFPDRGTPSGKIELVSEAAERRGAPRVATYVPDDGAGTKGTFQLVSAPSSATHNSTFLHVARHRARLGEPVVHVHPKDAESVGIAEGEPVRLVSEFGSITLVCKLDPESPRKMARVDGFVNEDLVPEDACINSLVSPQVSDHGGGNVLYSVRVELEPVAAPVA